LTGKKRVLREEKDAAVFGKQEGLVTLYLTPVDNSFSTVPQMYTDIYMHFFP